MFLTDSHGHIVLKNFNTTIGLFGKFYEKAVAASIIEAGNAIHNAPWFWGIFTSEQAASVLLKHEQGSYLIRVSVTRGPQFALSFSAGKGKVQHYLINKMVTEFVCGDYKAGTLPDLVLELVEVFGLTNPAPRDEGGNLYCDGPSR